VINHDRHYCKHDMQWFMVELPHNFTGDVFLTCPTCHWKHYRHFVDGVAVHCDISKRHDDPVEIKCHQ
jgi:hypothetical protein